MTDHHVKPADAVAVFDSVAIHAKSLNERGLHWNGSVLGHKAEGGGRYYAVVVELSGHIYFPATESERGEFYMGGAEPCLNFWDAAEIADGIAATMAQESGK